MQISNSVFLLHLPWLFNPLSCPTLLYFHTITLSYIFIQRLRRFKALADRQKGISDDDLQALMGDEVHQSTTIWELLDIQVCEREFGEEGVAVA